AGREQVVQVGIIHQCLDRALHAGPVAEGKYGVERRAGRRRRSSIMRGGFAAIEKVIADARGVGEPKVLVEYRFEQRGADIDSRAGAVIRGQAVVSLARYGDRPAERKGDAVIRNVVLYLVKVFNRERRGLADAEAERRRYAPTAIFDEVAVCDLRLHAHGVETKGVAIGEGIVHIRRTTQFAIGAADHTASHEIIELR